MLKQVNVNCNFADRNVLSEGRNFGLGFAMCKKTAEGEFQAAHPISACKDYLNDVILVEQFNITNKVDVYGLKYVRSGILEPDGTGFMFIHPLGYKGGVLESESFSLSREIKNLHDNIDVVIKTVAELEKLLSFPKTDRTVFYKDTKSDGYLVHMAKQWVANPLMISMFTLVLRVAQYGAKKPSYVSQLVGSSSVDSQLVNALRSKINYLIETKLTVLPFDHTPFISSPSNVHNYGIASFDLKKYVSTTKDIPVPIVGVYITDGGISFKKATSAVLNK